MFQKNLGEQEMIDFDPREYWEQRLSNMSLNTVGHRNLGGKYNYWLYKIKKRQLEKCLHKYQIATERKSILDIGSGSGFYIDFWSNKGASRIVGIDITKAAVNFLKKKYPRYSFYCCDITASDVPGTVGGKFDIVSAFDVLYHIIDDNLFETAIRNISKLCAQGGYFLLSDNFMQHNDIVSSYYLKSRFLRDYEEILQHEGFRILGRVPVFHIMVLPADGRNVIEIKAYSILWSVISRCIDISPTVTGRVVYTIDLFLNMISSEGPGTEIMICKKL